MCCCKPFHSLSVLVNRNSGGDFETCSKLEDLNLDVKKNVDDVNNEISVEDFAGR